MLFILTVLFILICIYNFDSLYSQVTVFILYLWLMHVGCFCISVFKCEWCNMLSIVLLLIVYIFYALLLYIRWMLMHVGCFLNFVSSIHWLTMDEFFAYMLDLSNDSVTCTLCFWLVPTLFGAFLFDEWHILYPWSVNMFLTCEWIYLNTINTIQYTLFNGHDKTTP
jgi:hypothetical protein